MSTKARVKVAMARLCLVLVVCLLTSCGSLWMVMYRAKGGYYDRPAVKKVVKENATQQSSEGN